MFLSYWKSSEDFLNYSSCQPIAALRAIWCFVLPLALTQSLLFLHLCKICKNYNIKPYIDQLRSEKAYSLLIWLLTNGSSHNHLASLRGAYVRVGYSFVTESDQMYGQKLQLHFLHNFRGSSTPPSKFRYICHHLVQSAQNAQHYAFVYLHIWLILMYTQLLLHCG